MSVGRKAKSKRAFGAVVPRLTPPDVADIDSLHF